MYRKRINLAIVIALVMMVLTVTAIWAGGSMRGGSMRGVRATATPTPIVGGFSTVDWANITSDANKDCDPPLVFLVEADGTTSGLGNVAEGDATAEVHVKYDALQIGVNPDCHPVPGQTETFEDDFTANIECIKNGRCVWSIDPNVLSAFADELPNDQWTGSFAIRDFTQVFITINTPDGLSTTYDLTSTCVPTTDFLEGTNIEIVSEITCSCGAGKDGEKCNNLD